MDFAYHYPLDLHVESGEGGGAGDPEPVRLAGVHVDDHRLAQLAALSEGTVLASPDELAVT